jgi:DnaK suppressor protein
MVTTRDSERYDRLKALLTERREALLTDVRRRMRQERLEHIPVGVDTGEQSDADTHRDLTFALLEIRAQTLVQIDTALSRLEAGDYGVCIDCDGPIAHRRLEIVPFALRCQICEGTREHRRDGGLAGGHRLERFALPM